MTEQTIFIHERGEKCSECGGSGVSGGFDCEQCDGEGYLDEPRPAALPLEEQNDHE
jgi:DnaJ-class molecular chaperone